MSKYIVVDHEIEGSSRQERLPVELTNDNKIPAALLQGGGGGAPSIVASFPAEPAEGDQIILTAADQGYPPGEYIYHSSRWMNKAYPAMEVLTFTINGGPWNWPVPYFGCPVFITWGNGASQWITADGNYPSNYPYGLGYETGVDTDIATSPYTFTVAVTGKYELEVSTAGFGSSSNTDPATNVTINGNAAAKALCWMIENNTGWTYAGNTIDLSGYTGLRFLYVSGVEATDVTITGCAELDYFDVSTNALPVSVINAILLELDANGLTNGYVGLSSQTPAAAPTGAGATAAASLVAKGWTVTTD